MLCNTSHTFGKERIPIWCKRNGPRFTSCRNVIWEYWAVQNIYVSFFCSTTWPGLPTSHGDNWIIETNKSRFTWNDYMANSLNYSGIIQFMKFFHNILLHWKHNQRASSFNHASFQHATSTWFYVLIIKPADEVALELRSGVANLWSWTLPNEIFSNYCRDTRDTI